MGLGTGGGRLVRPPALSHQLFSNRYKIQVRFVRCELFVQGTLVINGSTLFEPSSKGAKKPPTIDDHP